MSEETVGNEIPGEKQQQIEQQAREQGWKPESEWVGDKSKWKPAEEYLEVAEKVHKVKSSRLEREVREMRELLQMQHQSLKKSEEAGYRRALEEIAQKQRQAVEEADTAAFDAEERKKQEILKQAREALAKGQPRKPDPEFEEWRDENDWYDSDPDMKAYANGISTQVMKETGKEGRALYDEVAKRAKKVFAHKFQNPRRSESASVEGEGGAPPKKKGKTFSDLPAEAKKAFAKFEKQIPGFTKEDYLKNYVWE